jgi:hypothetical protein
MFFCIKLYIQVGIQQAAHMTFKNQKCQVLQNGVKWFLKEYFFVYAQVFPWAISSIFCTLLETIHISKISHENSGTECMLLQILFHPIIHLLFHKSWLVFEWIGSNIKFRFNRRGWLLCFQLWVDNRLKLSMEEHDNFFNPHCLLDFHETMTYLASVMIKTFKMGSRLK